MRAARRGVLAADHPTNLHVRRNGLGQQPLTEPRLEACRAIRRGAINACRANGCYALPMMLSTIESRSSMSNGLPTKRSAP